MAKNSKAEESDRSGNFMVTSRWRGAMHVSPMRIFDTLHKARDYVKAERKNELSGGEVAAYELFPDREPLKLRLE